MKSANARDLKTLMRFFMKCQYIPHFEIQLPKADKAPIQTYTDDELRKLLKKPDVRKCIFSTYTEDSDNGCDICSFHTDGTILGWHISNQMVDAYGSNYKIEDGNTLLIQFDGDDPDDIEPVAFSVTEEVLTLQYSDYTQTFIKIGNNSTVVGEWRLVNYGGSLTLSMENKACVIQKLELYNDGTCTMGDIEDAKNWYHCNYEVVHDGSTLYLGGKYFTIEFLDPGLMSLTLDDGVRLLFMSGPAATMTEEKYEALKSARFLARSSAYSYQMLIKVLQFSHTSEEAAVFAADNCGVDWYEQAARCVQIYLEHNNFSRDELIDKLEAEGFTHEQAVYGVDQNGL